VRTYSPKSARGPRTAPLRSTLPDLTHFRRVPDPIPLQLPTARTLQAPLAVSQPGDESERQAERLSDAVMRMPASPGGEALRAVSQPAPPGSARPGHPLDPQTRQFMESRFRHDFSQVRVHDGAQAAASARSLQALAYTRGSDIAFARGQYNPTSEAGKRLLAHELAHTLQPSDGRIQRKYDFTDPKPNLLDPIPLALSGKILGNTIPGFNGKLLPKNAIKKDYKEAVFKILEPQTYSFSKKEDGSFTAKVDPKSYNLNVFAEVNAITKPDGAKWSGSYPVTVMSSPPKECAEKAKEQISIEMQGKPNSKALYEKVQAHEQEHVDDLKKISSKELKPYHDLLLGFTGKGNSEEGAVKDIFKQVSTKDAEAAKDWVDKWIDAVQVYDKPGGTHHSKFKTTVDADCKTATITEREK
jgi:hypothetical protein